MTQHTPLWSTESVTLFVMTKKKRRIHKQVDRQIKLNCSPNKIKLSGVIIKTSIVIYLFIPLNQLMKLEFVKGSKPTLACLFPNLQKDRQSGFEGVDGPWRYEQFFLLFAKNFNRMILSLNDNQKMNKCPQRKYHVDFNKSRD